MTLKTSQLHTLPYSLRKIAQSERKSTFDTREIRRRPKHAGEYPLCRWLIEFEVRSIVGSFGMDEETIAGGAAASIVRSWPRLSDAALLSLYRAGNVPTIVSSIHATSITPLEIFCSDVPDAAG